jgi:hypothetical protein
VSQNELPPGYETLNEEELAAALQRDEECRQLAKYERQKQLDLQRRELIRKQWCEDQGFDE